MLAGAVIWIFGLLPGLAFGWYAGNRNKTSRKLRNARIPPPRAREAVAVPQPEFTEDQLKAIEEVQQMKASGKTPLMEFMGKPDENGTVVGWKYEPKDDITPAENAVLTPALMILQQRPEINLETIEGWDTIKRHFTQFKLAPPTNTPTPRGPHKWSTGKKDDSGIVPYLPLKGRA